MTLHPSNTLKFQRAEEAPPHEPSVIVFYLVPHFAMLTFSLAVEALRLANRVLGYEAYSWRLVSESGVSVTASCGLDIAIESSVPAERKCLFDCERPRMVIVCAEHGVENHSSKALEAWLRECKSHSVTVGALGAGPHILARAGLLRNKSCTIHWEHNPGFSERFIDAEVNTSIFQVDGNVWTCAGGTASLDMMLHLVQQDFGESTVASICAHALVQRARTPYERQRLPPSLKHGILNEIVIGAIAYMERQLTEPLSMNELAAQVNRSRRQVERLFKIELGRSPIHYYRELRLERAGLLLTQSQMPIIEIAVACGFNSPSHFSRSFWKTYRMSPQEVRRANVVPSKEHVFRGERLVKRFSAPTIEHLYGSRNALVGRGQDEKCGVRPVPGPQVG